MCCTLEKVTKYKLRDTFVCLSAFDDHPRDFTFLCLLSFEEAGRHCYRARNRNVNVMVMSCHVMSCHVRIDKWSRVNIRDQSKARKRNSRFSTSNQNRSNKETTIYDLTDSLRTANFLFMTYGTRDFQHLHVMRTAATKR